MNKKENLESEERFRPWNQERRFSAGGFVEGTDFKKGIRNPSSPKTLSTGFVPAERVAGPALDPSRF